MALTRMQPYGRHMLVGYPVALGKVLEDATACSKVRPNSMAAGVSFSFHPSR